MAQESDVPCYDIREEETEIILLLGEEAKFAYGVNSKLKETAIIIMALSVNFLGLTIDTMPMQFFGYEATKNKNLGELQVGLIFGCYDLARLIVAPFSSMVILKISAKRSLILGASLCGLSAIAFGLVGYIDGLPIVLFILCMVMRGLSGAGAALISVSSASITLKAKSYTNATIFGWIEIVDGSGSMMGALIGGALYKLVGYSLTFIISGSLVISSALLTYLTVPYIVDDVKQEKRKSFLDLIRIPGMFILFLVCSVGQLSYQGRTTMVAAWVVETFDVTVSTWSLLYSAAALAYMIGNIPASMVTNKGYVFTSMITNWIALILCFLFMCPAPFFDQLFNHKHYLVSTEVFYVLSCFNLPFLYVSLFQIVLSLAREYGHDVGSAQTYAQISSMITAGWALGAMLGPPVSGALTQHLSFEWSVTISAFLHTALLIIFVSFLILMKSSGRNIQITNDKPAEPSMEGSKDEHEECTE